MTEGLIDRLLQLTRRERFLLGLLAVIVLPALVWLLGLAPLNERRAVAERAWQDSQSQALWVLDQAGEQAQLNAAPGAAGVAMPIGISGLEQSLVVAGLRQNVRELGGEGNGRIALRFDAVVFTELMAWLSKNDLTWGYDITGLRLQRGEEVGMVAAELTLQPQI
jgi:general secretion pathway protein M